MSFFLLVAAVILTALGVLDASRPLEWIAVVLAAVAAFLSFFSGSFPRPR